mgnify:CR=1 FL=1
MANIIAGRKATGKFFYQYGFGEKLSSVPQKRLTVSAPVRFCSFLPNR